MSAGTVLPLVGSLLVLGLVLLGLAGMVRAGILDRNRAVGIRTRATKASDQAWTVGHRAALGAIRGTGAFCLGSGVVAGALALVVPGPLGSRLTLWAVGAGFFGLAVGLVLMVRRAHAAARGSGSSPR